LGKLLTDRQAVFASEYIIDNNATQAAIRAGYSPKGATVRGSELLANSKVRAAIERLRAAERARGRHKAEDILQGLADIAFDPAKKDADRIRALELLGKSQALFTDRLEQSGDGLSINIKSKGPLEAPARPQKAPEGRFGRN